jgi:hypothetical protein
VEIKGREGKKRSGTENEKLNIIRTIFTMRFNLNV